METETKTKETSKPILQTLGEGILKAQQEIDELAVQLSLGKTEAKEKFLLKLEILRLKFGIKGFEIKESFRTRMERAKKSIYHFANKEKRVGSRKTPIDFKEEIAEAYKHLKSKVKNL
jgi:hypothetical protein